MIIDAQLHCWQTLPRIHWTANFARDRHEPFPIEQALASMDAVGVTRGLFHVLSDGVDPGAADRYADEIASRYPTRVGFVAVVDPFAQDSADTVGRAKARGARALRLFFRNADDEAAYEAGLIDGFLGAARRHALPVIIYAPGRQALVGRIAGRFHDLPVILDHLGMSQPPRHDRDVPPLRTLADLLALKVHQNLFVKVTGVPSLSDRSYPFEDLTGPLRQIFDAFGVARCMWGSDMTRLWGLFTYSDLVTYLLHATWLSADEKVAVMGGTLARVLNWPATISR